jgi:hypothetical protein
MWSEPPNILAGDAGDAVVVLVIVQDWNADGFGGGGDEQIWMADRTMVQAALVGELLIDVKRTSPLPVADRAVR